MDVRETIFNSLQGIKRRKFVISRKRKPRKQTDSGTLKNEQKI